MAQEDHSYREILKFYYTDVEIQRLDGVDKDPVEAPVARNPRPTPPDTTERRIGW